MDKPVVEAQRALEETIGAALPLPHEEDFIVGWTLVAEVMHPAGEERHLVHLRSAGLSPYTEYGYWSCALETDWTDAGELEEDDGG